MTVPFGIVLNAGPAVSVPVLVERALRAEEDFDAGWVTSGQGQDAMATIAILAMATNTLLLGTCVVQTYPRHPVTLAQEAAVVDQVAPQRLRLGVGPSHKVLMERMGIAYDDPFGHLREYATILGELFRTGAVSFDGEHYSTEGEIERPIDVAILLGALQPGTFRLSATVADGAITWLCPPSYLADVAVPTMRRTAADLGRDRPRLIAHLAVCVHDRLDEVIDEARRTIPNPAFPTYQRMLAASGFADASKGEWTREMVDGVIAWGSEAEVATRIAAMVESGADELLLRPMGAGREPTVVVERTLDTLAAIRRDARTGSSNRVAERAL